MVQSLLLSSMTHWGGCVELHVREECVVHIRLKKAQRHALGGENCDSIDKQICGHLSNDV